MLFAATATTTASKLFRVLTGSQPYGRAGGETFHHCNILRAVQVADNKARPDEITAGDRAGLEFTAALVDTLPADNLSVFASVRGPAESPCM